MLTCGTGLATGHSGFPKHASAAWDSGQMPKELQWSTPQFVNELGTSRSLASFHDVEIGLRKLGGCSVARRWS
jgi:hypothetical protein